MQLLIPAVLIAAAIGLFSVYTNPAYQELKGLQATVSTYDDALNKAKDLKSTSDDLQKKYNTITPGDIQKLEHMLPDNVDNLRLIIDINKIAKDHGVVLKGVALGSISDSKAARSASAVGSSGDAAGSVSVSFSLTTTYDNAFLFIAALERSLRLIDIERISFRPSGGPNYDLSMNIRTYWLH